MANTYPIDSLEAHRLFPRLVKRYLGANISRGAAGQPEGIILFGYRWDRAELFDVVVEYDAQ